MYIYYMGIKINIYCIFSGNYLGSVYFAIFQIQLISAVKLFIVCHKTSWQFKSVLNKIQVSFNLLLFILIGHELLNTLRNLLFYSKQLRLRSSNKRKSFQKLYLSGVSTKYTRYLMHLIVKKKNSLNKSNMKCHFTFSHSDWTKLYVSRKILFDRKKDNDLYIFCKRSCCID